MIADKGLGRAYLAGREQLCYSLGRLLSEEASLLAWWRPDGVAKVFCSSGLVAIVDPGC